MRYFILILAVIAVVTVGIAGRRGDISRKPPIYVFPDMKRHIGIALRPHQHCGSQPDHDCHHPFHREAARSIGNASTEGKLPFFAPSP